MIDAMIGGALMSKTPKAAYALMEKLESNNYQWTSFERIKPRPIARVIEVDQVSNLNAQLATLIRRFDNFVIMNVSAAQTTKTYGIVWGSILWLSVPMGDSKLPSMLLTWGIPIG